MTELSFHSNYYTIAINYIIADYDRAQVNKTLLFPTGAFVFFVLPHIYMHANLLIVDFRLQYVCVSHTIASSADSISSWKRKQIAFVNRIMSRLI